MILRKFSSRPNPLISVVMLDWGVRESFHLLHYLDRQDIDRDLFETVAVEFYDTVSPALIKHQEQVDTWALLETPRQRTVHKHRLINAGILLGQGRIIVVCDSDSMVKPGFIRSIIEAFQNDDGIVLHLDEFRNICSDLYPFRYPSFDEVLGKGCLNCRGGVTSGLMDAVDPLHSRNFGACMCARRSDLASIGGADEHQDFLGHSSGPYEMSFRLLNLGRRVVWHKDQFLYHTWHPGQGGGNDFIGPHDGHYVSTTGLEPLVSGRILPLAENPALKRLRLGGRITREEIAELLVPTEPVGGSLGAGPGQGGQRYRGYLISRLDNGFQARLPIRPPAGEVTALEEAALGRLKARIDALRPERIGLAGAFIGLYAALRRSLAEALRLAKVWTERRRLGLYYGPVAAGPKRPNRLKSRLDAIRLRLAEKIACLGLDIRYHFTSIQEMLLVLLALEATGVDLTLLADNRLEGPTLTWLKRLGLLKRLKIVRLAGAGDLTAWLNRPRNGQVAISRGLFIQHHDLLATLVSNSELMVV